jgi:SAM-dependent methyltransferase
MDLNELQKNWDEFGKTDPLWAILTESSRKGGQWNLEEFFASGRQDIVRVMQRAQVLGFPAGRDTALDFGCGVGRLTQALCPWFERCCGVDIAPSMIDLARQYNTHGDRCQYLVNACSDLRVFTDNSFDLVYSKIVLQHMEPRYSTTYIGEFVRVLRTGGLAVFQIPARPRAYREQACGPLPDGGFHASLTGHPATIRAVAGSQVSVPVTIGNESECAWPSAGDRYQKYAVKLGNHWLTEESQSVVWDDGRQLLPYDLEPNAEIRTEIVVTAPLSAGKYILELDMVQEGVAWFKHKSSSPAWVQAEIDPAATPVVAGAAGAPPPRMEVYGVEKDEVVEILTARGAKVLDIADDSSAGPKWIGFLYFATKL